MPVQINEVIIRAVVDPSSNTIAANEPEYSTGSRETEVEIVEKILEIMKEKQER